MTRNKNLPLIEKLNIKTSCLELYEHFKGLPYSFFLDSALPSEKLGKFSFIGMKPFLIFKSKKDHITLDWITRKETRRGNPFSALKGLLEEFRVDSQEKFPFPFIGGGVGYFAYDLKDFNERLPDKAEDDLDIPDCIFCFYDTVLAFDHHSEEFSIISLNPARLTDLSGLLKNRFNKRPERSVSRPARRLGIESNFTRESYISAVLKAKEYIKSGDIYQVNLSQRFKVELNTEPFELYKILRKINPAPFAAFLNFGEVKIVSASPERFLRLDGGEIETRPIKGTRPRGESPAKDEALKRELNASAKDRAENLMIIDLERNDLGRISKYGSVRVTEFMACEEYATVFHLVSTVRGELRDNVDAIDCLRNCFPGGSITGAPKIRAMEIIEELEPVKRALYTGSIGYISFDGKMDTSIAIRTFIIKNNTAYFQVGGGIVYDSDPGLEYQETLDKAKALILSLRGAKGAEACLAGRQAISKIASLPSVARNDKVGARNDVLKLCK